MVRVITSTRQCDQDGTILRMSNLCNQQGSRTQDDRVTKDKNESCCDEDADILCCLQSVHVSSDQDSDMDIPPV
jgi:hypothetical protein